MKKSYISKKVELKNSENGKGLFVKEKINKDEIVIDFSNGPGKVLTDKQYEKFFESGYDYGLQIDDDAIFAARSNNELEAGDFINHSCKPNCGIKKSLKIVAMRDINPNEEITFDYAMSESTPYTMKCNCQSKNCRRKITGKDWQIKELQRKYKGYFSDYLQKKIDGLS